MIWMVFFLFLIGVSGFAEEEAMLGALNLGQAEQFANEQGIDMMGLLRSILSGELPLRESIQPMLSEGKKAMLSDFSGIAGRLILPAILLLALKLMLSKDYAARNAVTFVMRVSCVAALADGFISMRGVAESLLAILQKGANMLSPAMIAAVSLAGAETTAAFLSPMSGVCVNLIQHFLMKWGIALSGAAACFAIAGNLGAGVRLKRLHDLCKQIVQTGSGGILAGFVAILSIQGRLGAGRDTAAARTTRYAVESMIPVVGGNVSDSLDSLLSTALIVKNALGAGACILIVCACIVPMMRLLGMIFFLRLSAAVTEPLGDDSLTGMIAQFSAAVQMLLVVCVVSAVLCGLLMGSCIGAASNVVR